MDVFELSAADLVDYEDFLDLLGPSSVVPSALAPTAVAAYAPALGGDPHCEEACGSTSVPGLPYGVQCIQGNSAHRVQDAHEQHGGMAYMHHQGWNAATYPVTTVSIYAAHPQSNLDNCRSCTAAELQFYAAAASGSKACLRYSGTAARQAPCFGAGDACLQPSLKQEVNEDSPPRSPAGSLLGSLPSGHAEPAVVSAMAQPSRGNARGSSHTGKLPVSHSTIEKQRRDRLNTLIEELGVLVPPLNPKHRNADSDDCTGSKRPKHSILADVLMTFRSMQQRLQQLESALASQAASQTQSHAVSCQQVQMPPAPGASVLTNSTHTVCIGALASQMDAMPQTSNSTACYMQTSMPVAGMGWGMQHAAPALESIPPTSPFVPVESVAQPMEDACGMHAQRNQLSQVEAHMQAYTAADGAEITVMPSASVKSAGSFHIHISCGEVKNLLLSLHDAFRQANIMVAMANVKRVTGPSGADGGSTTSILAEVEVCLADVTMLKCGGEEAYIVAAVMAALSKCPLVARSPLHKPVSPGLQLAPSPLPDREKAVGGCNKRARGK